MRVVQGNPNQLTKCVFYREWVTHTWHTQITHVTLTTGQLSIMGFVCQVGHFLRLCCDARWAEYQNFSTMSSYHKIIHWHVAVRWPYTCTYSYVCVSCVRDSRHISSRFFTSVVWMCDSARGYLALQFTVMLQQIKSLAVSLRTTRFNNQTFCMVLALCWGFCTDLRTESDFCFVHH
jgi:hypothetical protein